MKGVLKRVFKGAEERSKKLWAQAPEAVLKKVNEYLVKQGFGPVKTARMMDVKELEEYVHEKEVCSKRCNPEECPFNGYVHFINNYAGKLTLGVGYCAKHYKHALLSKLLESVWGDDDLIAELNRGLGKAFERYTVEELNAALAFVGMWKKQKLEGGKARWR